MAISRENIRKETKSAQRKVMSLLRKQVEARGASWSDIEDASEDDLELRNLQEWQHAAKALEGAEEQNSASAENRGWNVNSVNADQMDSAAVNDIVKSTKSTKGV